jgi:hypothetical protein
VVGAGGKAEAGLSRRCDAEACSLDRRVRPLRVGCRRGAALRQPTRLSESAGMHEAADCKSQKWREREALLWQRRDAEGASNCRKPARTPPHSEPELSQERDIRVSILSGSGG